MLTVIVLATEELHQKCFRKQLQKGFVKNLWNRFLGLLLFKDLLFTERPAFVLQEEKLDSKKFVLYYRSIHYKKCSKIYYSENLHTLQRKMMTGEVTPRNSISWPWIQKKMLVGWFLSKKDDSELGSHRISRPEVFGRCLKVWQNLKESTVASLWLKKETLAYVFSCEFSKNLKNTSFEEHLWMAPSVTNVLNFVMSDILKSVDFLDIRLDKYSYLSWRRLVASWRLVALDF